MGVKNTTSETSIEKYFIKKCKEQGMKVIKMVPTYENGIPDRQVLFKGFAGFAEIKKPGKTASPLQVVYLRELGKAGCFVGVVDSKEAVMEWIENFVQHVDELIGKDIIINMKKKIKLPEVDKSKIERYNR